MKGKVAPVQLERNGNMLGELLREILFMEYPREEIEKGLADEKIECLNFAATYGFSAAKEKIIAIIRGHMVDEMIAKLYHQSADFKRYVDKYCNDYGYTTTEALKHALVREVAKEYQLAQKVVGDDYKNQIMDRFLRVE